MGLILEFLARILAALEADLGAPVFHFEGPGALRGSILSILQQFCRIYENHGKTQVFSWFFFDFEGSGVIKIGRKCDKIELGVSWNAKKFEQIRWGRQDWLDWLHKWFWGKETVARMSVPGGGTRSDPRTTQRAWATGRGRGVVVNLC